MFGIGLTGLATGSVSTVSAVQTGISWAGTYKYTGTDHLDLQHWSNIYSNQPGTALIEGLINQQTSFATGSRMTMAHLVFAALHIGIDIVDNSEINFLELVGTGANMAVYKGTSSGKLVALKRIRQHSTDDPTTSGRRLTSIEMEMRVSASVAIKEHPNVATLESFSWSTDEFGQLEPILIMELALLDCSTLAHLVDRVQLSDFTTKGYMITDIIAGLAALHENYIIHGDLKPDNILVFPREPTDKAYRYFPYILKITDFG